MRCSPLILGLISCANNGTSSSSSNQFQACSAGPSPSIEVGHGELRFETFDQAENTPVELIHGPQGGYHSTIAVRAAHLDPDRSYIIDLVGVIDGLELGGGTPLAQFRCNYAAEAQEFKGGLLVWDSVPEELHDKRATVNVYVIDPSKETSDGQPVIVAQDTAEYTIWDPALEI